jgi:phage-related protein
MAENTGLSIQPAEVLEVTRQLDALADRVQQVMTAEAANLTVTPSARDEVSQRVAETLNEVHTRYGAATEQGVTELREVAATLRAHSHNIVAADEDFIR